MHRQSDKLLLAPTDLSNFLSCRHLSALDVKVAAGEAVRPVRYGPFIEELQMRGTAHEMAYLQHLRNLGLNIDLDASSDSGQWGDASAVERTLAAMKAGKDIIYQAALSDNKLLSLRLFHCLFLKLICSHSVEVSRIVFPGGIQVEAGTLWAA
ncbi:MAG: hypothetical protein OXC05_03585 [Halieaceae bacterium]|nr:hypothetical protein [Halieaceae bacterium]